ncbi:MAG: hypothetical protein K2Q10_14490 [Rhodospirillales bacterium]|nr:hypothetical protein [Rhodospirillales bacterium]
MALLSFFEEKKTEQPADPQWRRNNRGFYFRLMTLNTKSLSKVGGVYVIWHAGVNPAWLYCGLNHNIGLALTLARDEPAISVYEPQGGLYVTWSPIAEPYRPGVQRYLRAVMKPVIFDSMFAETFDDKARLIPVRLPG